MYSHLKSSALFTTSLLAAQSLAADSHDQYSRTLKFRSDGTFKIAILSDLGFNENSEDYLQTQGLIETLLSNENPDLIVLTGDVVDPDHAEEYDYHWSSALELIKANNVPYVWTGGNKIPKKSMYDLHEVDYMFGTNLSWTGYVWDMHLENPQGTKTYE